MKTLFSYTDRFKERIENKVKGTVCLEEHYFNTDILQVNDYVELDTKIIIDICDTDETLIKPIKIKAYIKNKTIIANSETNDAFVLYTLKLTAETENIVTEFIKSTNAYKEYYEKYSVYKFLQNPT